MILPFLVIILLVTSLRLPTFSRSVLDWDESLYILMAGQWLQGHLPYTTIWDNKPIGIYAIFAAFELLFRQPVPAMRAATVVAVSLTAFGLSRLAPRGSLAVLAAASYIIGSLSNDGLSANTETFMECATVYAVLAAISGRGAARRGFAVGLLLAVACMIKYVAVFEAPALAFALLARQPDTAPRQTVRTILAAIAGGLLPPALTILTYAASGHLALWWQCSVIANITRVSVPILPSQVHQAAFVFLPRWLPFVSAGIILFAAAPALLRSSPDPAAAGRRKFHVTLMLWLAGGAVGVASAKSFYDHYFLQILPPLCLAFVCVVALAARRLRGAPRAVFIAFAVGLLAVPAKAGYAALAAITGPDTPARIAASLRPAIAAGATLYVFDGQPIVYALTGAALPTRYVFPSVLTKCALARVAGINPAQEVAAILSTNPAFIIRNRFPPATGTDAAVYTELTKTVATRYMLFESFNDAAVYKLDPTAKRTTIQPLLDSCGEGSSYFFEKK